MRSLAATALALLSACTTPSPPRAARSPEALLADVADFAQPTQPARLATLKAQLTAAGLAFAIEDFGGARAEPGHNVSVRTGPATGKEIMLVAHYDAVALPSGRLVDGVVDNAASVVAMIEATRRLAEHTRHPVRLLLTDEEELGLLGARAWIAAHGVANIAAVIVADVNGYGETLMYGLNTGDPSALLVADVRELCDQRRLLCLDFPNYPPSDDVAFAAAGAPTLSVGHLPRVEAEQLKLFMDPPPNVRLAPPAILQLLHTPADEIGKVEAATLSLAADAFVALVQAVDARG